MIDKSTVDKILDTADIVDVVSDFVSLKRRGSNFVGLCPFHDEKTPSFSVSPSRQYCHCFGCGKGGSPVGFIMEHEQLSYPEALRYLARKYHIEVEEKEMTSEERAAQSEREALLMLNDFACDYFEKQLHETVDGKEIGLSYFRERGFTVETIKKFRLGYSPDSSTAFYRHALDKGYNQKLLFDIGLCIDDKRGGGFDRFRGRVMFPVFNVAGKIIAFGGRTLKKDPAKYLNSPESVIYVKNKELYGLFQAKRAIVKEDKCFLVEGYTDVISMNQAGIENVVASSGTSLTEGQIRMIHRFTNNVTVLYDGDSAGIHASLRGIDMLLAEGLNIKVLLLPDGEDPDSFARTHTVTEFRSFIEANESDFITFKMNILLGDAADDPIKRSAVIGDVVRSISVIPNEITRSLYVKSCSERLGITEDILMRELSKNIARNFDEKHKRIEREQRRANVGETTQSASSNTVQPVANTVRNKNEVKVSVDDKIINAERNVIYYVAKFGFCYLCDTTYENENRPTTVIEFINNELYADGMVFSNAIYNKLFTSSMTILPEFYDSLNLKILELENRKKDLFKKSVDEIAQSESGYNMSTIEKLENEARKRIESQAEDELADWRMNYLEKRLINDPDNDIRNTTVQLIQEPYQLSKIHTQYANIGREYDRLNNLIPLALNIWKSAIIEKQLKDLSVEIENVKDNETLISMLTKMKDLNDLRRQLAKITGDRVVNP